jgi:Kelch motif protein
MTANSYRPIVPSVVVILMVAFSALVPTSAAPPEPTGSGPAWAKLAPVPSVGSGVEGMSVADVGDNIIAALGFDSGAGDTATTRIYNIASDTWTFGNPAPGPSSEGAGTSHGGLFYTLGGRFIGARTDLWSYNPVSDTWTVLSSMPVGRAGLGVAVVGDAIYAIGGRTATGGPCTGGPLSDVERYDIASDTWTTVAPLPSPRSDLAASVVGGKVYVFGGCRTQASILHDVDVYDPVTDTWDTSPADMPTARAGMYAVANKGGTVYVIGGWDGVGTGLNTNEAYKVARDVWTTGLLPMPTARAESGAAGHGGRIYIVGGSRPAFGASVNANEAFKP